MPVSTRRLVWAVAVSAVAAVSPTLSAAFSTKSSADVAVAEDVLARHRVVVVSRDVGGALGRKVAFSTFSGEIAVYKIERIRETDWYGR